MKKIFALLLALALFVSLAACGSKPLPVKFGKVTSVETIGENAEAIVLSMEKPSSSQGAERDVYIATVDYIFTHASRDLEELSVTAYSPSGSSIISFTIPSDIIANMRKVDATGKWGTAGFCGYYYMNHTAYDKLVASIKAANE